MFLCLEKIKHGALIAQEDPAAWESWCEESMPEASGDIWPHWGGWKYHVQYIRSIPCAIKNFPIFFYHWILNHERIPSSSEPGFAREFKWWPIQWVSMHICYLIFIHINALLHIWLSLMLCLKVLAPKEKPTGSTSVEDPETVSWHNCQIWGKYYGHFLGWLQVIISLIAC